MKFIKNKTNILIFILYLLIFFVIFYNRILNIYNGYGMPDVDTDGTLWYYWARVFLDQKNLFFNFNVPIAYPFGYDVSHIPYFSLFYEFIVLIVRNIGNSFNNIILVSNILSLSSYPISSFCVYFLSLYLLEDKIASFFAGLIFGCSFYFILMSGGALSNNQLFLIPLYYITLFYFIKKRNLSSLMVSAFYFGIFFMTNVYWSFFSIAFSLPIFLFYYNDSSWQKKMKNIFLYYLTVLSVTFFLNIGFIYQNVSDINKYGNAVRIINQHDQLINVLSYFTPSKNNFLYQNFLAGFGDNFMGYGSLFILFLGLFTISDKEYRKTYNVFLLCFLLAILFSCNIPGFTFLNDIYFKIFGTFRAVSRLNIFASLFLSLIVGVTIKYFNNYKFKYIIGNKRYYAYAAAIFLAIFIIFEGLNIDSWRNQITGVKELENTYLPIKNNKSIKIVAQYPVWLSNGVDGFPPSYQLIAQIIHNKNLVSGADPFNNESIQYFNSIKDVLNIDTINNLSRYNVDTIIINKNLYPNPDEVVNILKKDNRLLYLGNYKGEYDKDGFLSTNELSRNIEVFQIKKVLERNK